MTVGIDGDQWYCCNGLGLGDPRAKYVFADTLRKAMEGYNAKYPEDHHSVHGHDAYLDMTVAEYKKATKQR